MFVSSFVFNIRYFLNHFDDNFDKKINTKRYQIKKTIATIVIGMNTLKLKKIVCKIKMFLLEIPQDWRLFQCWSSGLQALKSN